jgi:DNA polymerase elongation subunit (family B)
MRLCDNCLRRHWKAKINKSTGLQVKHNNGNLIYIYIYCGHVQEEEKEFIKSKPGIAANILYIDIELSKTLVYNYGLRVPSKYINPDDLVKERSMIAWAASYVGNNKVWSQIVTPKKALEWCDREIVRGLWDLMNATEIIAGHNVDGFDIKHINTRFHKHGLPPIVGKKTLDTLKIARRKYAFESNRLDFISKWLGLGGKDDIRNGDWLEALKGNEKTLEKIQKYNKGDVINGKAVLEELLTIENKKIDYGAVRAEWVTA